MFQANFHHQPLSKVLGESKAKSLSPNLLLQSVSDIESLLALHSIFIEEDDEDIQLMFNSYDSPEGVLQQISLLKSEGNSLYKSHNFQSALLIYQKAVKFICITVPMVCEQSKICASFPQCTDLVISLHLNIAACELKLLHWDNVVHCCSLVLGVNPNNVKAMFRRACAYHKLGCPDKAVVDLEKSLMIEPNNKDIQMELAKVEETKLGLYNNSALAKKTSKRQKLKEPLGLGKEFNHLRLRAKEDIQSVLWDETDAQRVGEEVKSELCGRKSKEALVSESTHINGENSQFGIEEKDPVSSTGPSKKEEKGLSWSAKGKDQYLRNMEGRVRCSSVIGAESTLITTLKDGVEPFPENTPKVLHKFHKHDTTSDKIPYGSWKNPVSLGNELLATTSNESSQFKDHSFSLRTEGMGGEKSDPLSLYSQKKSKQNASPTSIDPSCQAETKSPKKLPQSGKVVFFNKKNPGSSLLLSREDIEHLRNGKELCFFNSRSLTTLKVKTFKKNPIPSEMDVLKEAHRNHQVRVAEVCECEEILSNSRSVEGLNDPITLKEDRPGKVSEVCQKSLWVAGNPEDHIQVEDSTSVLTNSNLIPSLGKFSSRKQESRMRVKSPVSKATIRAKNKALRTVCHKAGGTHDQKLRQNKQSFCSSPTTSMKDSSLEMIESNIPSTNVPFYFSVKKEENMTSSRHKSSFEISGKSDTTSMKKKNATSYARRRFLRSTAHDYAYHCKPGKCALLGTKRKFKPQYDDDLQQPKKKISSLRRSDLGKKGKGSVPTPVSLPLLCTVLEGIVTVET